MRHWINWILGIFAAAVVLALVILAFRPSSVLVEIANVTRGPMRITVNAEGRTRVRQRYIVSAPVMGRLGRIGLSEGDAVRPGTVLAELIPAPLDTRSISQNEAALQAAEAENRAANAQVEQARAALDHAQLERRRADQLLENGIASPQAEMTQSLLNQLLQKRWKRQGSLRMPPDFGLKRYAPPSCPR